MEEEEDEMGALLATYNRDPAVDARECLAVVDIMGVKTVVTRWDGDDVDPHLYLTREFEDGTRNPYRLSSRFFKNISVLNPLTNPFKRSR